MHLEPAPLVVVLGLGAVLRNLARENLFIQVSLGLFTPSFVGPSHQPAWLCLHLFTEGKLNFALTHLLQRNSHCLSLDRLSSKDIMWHFFSVFCSSFCFSQIWISGQKLGSKNKIEMDITCEQILDLQAPTVINIA